MLIDEITIKVRAGRGGRGAVAFNKIKLSLGPTGGSGGQGGSIYFTGVSDLGALKQFRFKKEVNAPDGENGRGQFLDGKSGEDIVIQVPVGTIIHNLNAGEEKEILKTGENILIAKGGKGGKGNFFFRSSRNTSPTQFQEGIAGEEFDLRLELKLIADIGFIGLPNVGKSSLLKELTNANPKVANYPFTTLEPNLGVYFDLILADIPGLIKGASAGKGLGIRFLRHIERTKILFHFISVESKDLAKDYSVIRQELKEYNEDLLKKQEYVFVSKADLVEKDDLEEKIKELKKKLKNKEIIAFSIFDDDSLKKIKNILDRIAQEK
ncbi:MAG: Obg family GTPase CgtA [Candidatus Pacebacteria bacterium]|nr:Obg family GTPase CgtA [Candidatus Paceibacterota bacterium]